MRGNDGFFLTAHGVKDGGREIGEALADAGAGFDDEMFAAGEGIGDGDGHLLLLRAVFEIAGFRENAAGRKEGFDLFDEVGVGAGGLGISDGDH